MNFTHLCLLLAVSGVADAAAPQDTIVSLEIEVQGLEIAKSDSDTIKDAAIKAAIVARLKTRLSKLQALLEAAVKQPAAEKEEGAKALAAYNADLKLVLWQTADILLDETAVKGADVKAILVEWKGIPGPEAPASASVSDVQQSINRLTGIDSDLRLDQSYLDLKVTELASVHAKYNALVCQEASALNLLASDTSIAASVKSGITDRVKALKQNVPGGDCK
jgi:hypothetical protein